MRMHSTLSVLGFSTILAGLLAGCQQPKMDMAEMMKPPPRPAELDQLEMLVGNWEGTSEMKMMGADKPMIMKGTDTISWDADKWLLVERSEGTMGDAGNKMMGLAVWTWDPQIKKFRLWGSDNYGMVMTGTATYDAPTKTWHMQGNTSAPARGEKSYGEGTLKMSTGNTMEWNWTEWDCNWKCQKYMEMHGTSHRK